MFTEKYMRQVFDDAPGLENLVDKYGDMTLRAYTGLIKKEYSDTRKENMPDPVIVQAVRDYAAGLIGEEETEACIRVMNKTGIIHTAGHHAVNYFPMMVQGNILCDYLVSLCTAEETVPFFTCTSLKMDNSFFPRGILLYDTFDGYECRIPVFPHSMRNVMVSHAPCYTDELLRKTEKKIRKQKECGHISARSEETLYRVINEVYEAPSVLDAKRYGTQITLANRIMSQGYFRDRRSRHVFLELEEVSRRVICHDLADEDSILNRFLGNRARLSGLHEHLEGVPGCWSGSKGGTFLFWGIDQRGHSYRLFPGTDPGNRSGLSVLSGRDTEGVLHTFETDPQRLIEGLEKRELLPGLFMTFFSLAIARNSVPAGGVYQGNYLKRMCRGVKKAWENTPEDTDDAARDWLAGLDKKRFPYLCGPLFLTSSYNGHIHPAGSIELLADPVSFAELENALDITFRKAHQLGLYCLYLDAVPAGQREPGWWDRVSEEIFTHEGGDA